MSCLQMSSLCLLWYHQKFYQHTIAQLHLELQPSTMAKPFMYTILPNAFIFDSKNYLTAALMSYHGLYGSTSCCISHGPCQKDTAIFDPPQLRDPSTDLHET